MTSVSLKHVLIKSRKSANNKVIFIGQMLEITIKLYTNLEARILKNPVPRTTTSGYS